MKSLAFGLCILIIFSIFIPMSLGDIISISVRKSTSSIIDNYSNPPEEEWNYTYKGSNGLHIFEISTGDYLIGGADLVNDELVYQLLKIDKEGNQKWIKTYGEPHAQLEAMAITNDDGCILLGEKGEPLYNDSVWCVRTDKNGNLLWNRTLNLNPNWGNPCSIEQVYDGGFIIAYDNHLEDKPLILKLDSEGFEEWDVTYDLEDGDAICITQTRDYGFALAGVIRYYRETKSDIFLIKTDKFGKEQWRTVYYSNNSYPIWRGIKVFQKSNNGFVILGEIQTGLYRGDVNALIINTNQYGEMLWNYSYGDLDNWEFPETIHETPDGGIIFGGLRITLGSNQFDGFIIKLDKIGNKQWSKIFGGEDQDTINSIEVTSDLRYILTGSSRSYGTYGNIVWVLKLNSENYPPNTPEIIGRRKFKQGEGGIYSYTIYSTDPNVDDVCFLINWSDGIQEWTGFYRSGEEITINVSIPLEKGTYEIFKIKAKDSFGLESDWATLEISVPRTKTKTIIWLRFIDIFQILERIFQIMK